MVQFTGLAHLHLKVANAERAAHFYEVGLGMKRLAVKHDGQLIALVMPGRRDVLTLSEGTIGAEVDRSAARVGDHGGIDHFGFALSTDSRLDEAIDWLTAAGATYVRHLEIAPGIPSVFLRDLDGYVFQIWAELPTGAAERATGVVAHEQPQE
jgi:catechol 2,3-dioxygenase-like lactoylglutathione lyase family enzyme